jgi:hypothetical protein
MYPLVSPELLQGTVQVVIYFATVVAIAASVLMGARV